VGIKVGKVGMDEGAIDRHHRVELEHRMRGMEEDEFDGCEEVSIIMAVQ
jgi:hypothetical protein